MTHSEFKSAPLKLKMTQTSLSRRHLNSNDTNEFKSAQLKLKMTQSEFKSAPFKLQMAQSEF